MPRVEYSAITGGFWTACADTRYMPYEQVSKWQAMPVDSLNDPGDVWQGLTALVWRSVNASHGRPDQ